MERRGFLQTNPNIRFFKPAINESFKYGTCQRTQKEKIGGLCVSCLMEGTHHSKFAVLWYQTGIRFACTTANFIEIGALLGHALSSSHMNEDLRKRFPPFRLAQQIAGRIRSGFPLSRSGPAG
jgi:hypothetical protein